MQWAAQWVGEDLAWLVIPDQPVLSGIGGVICTFVALMWARRAGLIWWKTLLAAIAAVIVAQVFGYLFWLITIADKIWADPWLVVGFVRGYGGQTSFGALTGAGIGAAAALWWLKAPTLKHADIMAPCGLIGIAWSRLGCVMRGCDYGVPSDLPWAMTYPDSSTVYRRHLAELLVEPHDAWSLPVHPFPLYLAAWCLLCFTLVAVFPNALGSKPGMRAVGVGLLYLAGRFCLEFFRHPGNAPMVLGPLNAGHAFALVALIALTPAFLWLRRRPAFHDDDRPAASA